MAASLLDIAKKYHTDKAFFYAPWYEKVLAGRDIKRILEMGIGSLATMKDSISRAGWTNYPTGASLYMWREYFPNATIHGLDNDPSTMFKADRIRTHLGDSRTWDCFLRFDLIIDDGNHDYQAQLVTRSNLLPSLRPNGLYVTEDISDPDSWPYPTVRFEDEYGKAALSVVYG
jgi:hypothetical protein